MIKVKEIIVNNLHNGNVCSKKNTACDNILLSVPFVKVRYSSTTTKPPIDVFKEINELIKSLKVVEAVLANITAEDPDLTESVNVTYNIVHKYKHRLGYILDVQDFLNFKATALEKARLLGPEEAENLVGQIRSMEESVSLHNSLSELSVQRIDDDNKQYSYIPTIEDFNLNLERYLIIIDLLRDAHPAYNIRSVTQILELAKVNKKFERSLKKYRAALSEALSMPAELFRANLPADLYKSYIADNKKLTSFNKKINNVQENASAVFAKFNHAIATLRKDEINKSGQVLNIMKLKVSDLPSRFVERVISDSTSKGVIENNLRIVLKEYKLILLYELGGIEKYDFKSKFLDDDFYGYDPGASPSDDGDIKE
jgi:hypothetical protein